MDFTIGFLLVLILILILVITYLAMYPEYIVKKDPDRHMPKPNLPQIGPYWTHGGQANTGLLY